MALRERVIAYVDEGHGDREAARHFRALPRFVNDLVIMIRQTGSLAPVARGHIGGGRLAAHRQWIVARMLGDGEPALDELCVELAGRGVIVHRLGLSHKKAYWQVNITGPKSHEPASSGPGGASHSLIRPRRGCCFCHRIHQI